MGGYDSELDGFDDDDEEDDDYEADEEYEDEEDDDIDEYDNEYTDDELTTRLYAEAFHIDDVIGKHIADLGFRFFHGVATPHLHDQLESATVERADIVVYPKGMPEKRAYELIRTAYRLAHVELSDDEDVLIPRMAILKTDIMPDSPHRFIEKTESLKTVYDDNRDKLSEFHIDDGRLRITYMMSRFEVTLDGTEGMPGDWIIMKLKKATHDYGYDLIPRFIEIISKPQESGFSSDYEGIRHAGSSLMMSYKSENGRTFSTYGSTIAYPADLSESDVKQVLKKMFEHAAEMTGNNAFRYIRSIYKDYMTDDEVAAFMSEED